MRRPPSTIILVACLSLLALQLSGLHSHVDADGYVGTPQGTHVHGNGTHVDGAGIDAHGHGGDTDHAGDKDVSIAELSTGASKILLFLVWVGLLLLIVLELRNKISLNFVGPPPTGRHARWRPPQRAPPRFSQALSH